jgi:hypothetical protein
MYIFLRLFGLGQSAFNSRLLDLLLGVCCSQPYRSNSFMFCGTLWVLKHPPLPDVVISNAIL